ncbi:MAG: M13 family metallopeptidase [Candidatus Saccharimonadales bacterium]
MNKQQFDTTMRPQDDYFGYVNNPWLRDHPVPATESSWGAFYELRDQSMDAVHALMNDLQKSTATLDRTESLIRDFYVTGLAFDSYADHHKETITELFTEIDEIASPRDLARVLGIMHTRDQYAFWSPYVDIDDKNSNLHVLRIHQSGLSLPNRDYYLDESDHMKDIRNKYVSYYDRIQTHVPTCTPAHWDAIWDIEQSLARASWTNVELRDVEKNYNRFSLDLLAQTYTFDWTAYFEGLGWENPSDNIIIGQPSYLQAVMEMITTRSIDDIKAYLKWRCLLGVVSWIDQKAADITFDFFGKQISGVQQIKPTWKRMVLLGDSLIIGEAIGRLYARKHFPEASKQAVLALVETVRTAYHTRIDRLTWMADATKQRAHTKLDNISVFIGYPSVWKNIDTLQFTSENHIANILSSRIFWSAFELTKVGNPPADEEWEMNAHTVNAYHHPNRLEIVFPAAILQPPFYSPDATYAENLGGIGAVIGHEFTHGFDDQGADFDEHGNTNRWQTDEERAAFDALAQHIVTQGDAFETVPGVFLQGKLILGEAIADVGGLELAIESLKMTHDDLDSIKELLVNFARCECGHATKERLIELAKVDPHPPSPFRVNAVVGHVSAFYEAYSVVPSDKLYLPPNKRAHIW